MKKGKRQKRRKTRKLHQTQLKGFKNLFGHKLCPAHAARGRIINLRGGGMNEIQNIPLHSSFVWLLKRNCSFKSVPQLRIKVDWSIPIGKLICE